MNDTHDSRGYQPPPAGYVYLFPDLMDRFGLRNGAKERAREITFALGMKVYFYALQVQGAKGACYASRATLARSLGRSVTQIDLHMARLLKKGMVERLDGYRYAFRPTKEFAEAAKEHLRKVRAGEEVRYFRYSPALAEARVKADQEVAPKARDGATVRGYRQRDVKARVTPAQYLAFEACRMAEKFEEAPKQKRLRELAGLACRQTLRNCLKKGQALRLLVRKGGRFLAEGWRRAVEKASESWRKKVKAQAPKPSNPQPPVQLPSKARKLNRAQERLLRQGLSQVMHACPWLDLSRASDAEAFRVAEELTARHASQGESRLKGFLQRFLAELRLSPPKSAFALVKAAERVTDAYVSS